MPSRAHYKRDQIGFVFAIAQCGHIAHNSLSLRLLPAIHPDSNWLCFARSAIRSLPLYGRQRHQWSSPPRFQVCAAHPYADGSQALNSRPAGPVQRGRAGSESLFGNKRANARCHACARAGMPSSRRTERAQSCHCEERSDEAISTSRIARAPSRRVVGHELAPDP